MSSPTKDGHNLSRRPPDAVPLSLLKFLGDAVATSSDGAASAGGVFFSNLGLLPLGVLDHQLGGTHSLSKGRWVPQPAEFRQHFHRLVVGEKENWST